MKSINTLFLFLFLSLGAAAQSDTVYWSPVRLTDSQFKKETPSASTSRQLTPNRHWTLEGYIFNGLRFSFETSGKTIRYEVVAYMLPYESWLKDHNDPLTLEHEQAHFDISEVFARKLRKRLSTVKDGPSARRLMHQYFDDLQDEQKRFDKAHRGESGVSDNWKKKIKEGLENNSEWTESSVTTRR